MDDFEKRLNTPTRHMLNGDRIDLIKLMLASPIANDTAAVVFAVCELLMQGQKEGLFTEVLPGIELLEKRVRTLTDDGQDEQATLAGRMDKIVDSVIEMSDMLAELMERVKILEQSVRKLAKKE